MRAHLLSVLAVCFALAVGIVLGSGPLRGEGVASLVDHATGSEGGTGSVRALRSQMGDLRRSGAYADDLTRSAAPALLGNSLQGHVVTLVVLPGAAASDVRGIGSMVAVAGGRVAMTVRADRRLVDVADRQLVDELGTQLAGRARGVRLPAGASSYQRIGALLGRAVGTRAAGGERVDATGEGILAGLGTAGLVSVRGTARQRGDLVVLITGAGATDAATRRGSGAVVASVALALDGATRGAVLAGPAAAAATGGQVAAVRADPAAAGRVSSVDSLGGAAGQIVTVLALAQQAGGGSGTLRRRARDRRTVPGVSLIDPGRSGSTGGGLGASRVARRAAPR